MTPSVIISNSVTATSFSDTLDKYESFDRQNADDAAWIQFLHDHYRYMIKNSIIQPVTEVEMLRYQYRLRDYLVDRHNGHADLERAVRIVNRINDDKDFNMSVKTLYIPDPQVVANLYRSFMTLQSKLRKLA